MGVQYTVRSVPEAVDRAVRHRAKREDKGSTPWLSKRARGLQVDAGTTEYTDLDHPVSTWQEAPAFDHAVADFEPVDGDARK